MKKKVLVVEDNRDTMELLKFTLERAGYEVACAYDGEEGCRKAKEILPDIILLDMMMPVMDGYTANRRLKEDAATRSIPVIVISARDKMSSLFDSASGASVDAYLVKPFTNQSLVEKVAKILLEKSA
ncbi:MAG: hypothetical protein A3G41_02360 [Elusimicrobia bacterium RIFCSPLOWO2_12_FULL_59_9]|nr:MAG: hypothetical protein A3G41_02360 [Elusimicrobia bacterium RIFCSPLOWO2_12_FULL_59_9]